MKKVLFYFIVSLIPLLAHDAPYSQEKFRGILQKSYLQAPTSSYNAHYGMKGGSFQYFQNRYFYLQDGKYMVFAMCGNRNRSELREKSAWHVSTLTAKTLFAKIYLFPLDQNKEFTFLQIHPDPKKVSQYATTINKPLLRIVWRKKYRGKYDHLWAIIRLSTDTNDHNYLKVDLGKRANNFFTIKIEVIKSRMKIFVNNLLKVYRDIHYWSGSLNYFKVGVYLQGDGCSKVLFDTLKLYDAKKIRKKSDSLLNRERSNI